MRVGARVCVYKRFTCLYLRKYPQVDCRIPLASCVIKHDTYGYIIFCSCVSCFPCFEFSNYQKHPYNCVCVCVCVSVTDVTITTKQTCCNLTRWTRTNACFKCWCLDGLSRSKHGQLTAKKSSKQVKPCANVVWFGKRRKQ